MSDAGRHPAPQQQPDWVYERFADVYDLLIYNRFSDRALEKCKKYLAESDLVVSRLLDLACGTGHFAIAMAEYGIDVVGVDGARAMIARARANSGRRKNNLRWRHGHFTDFEVPGQFELITCWFDSLNHLMTNRDVLRCFRRVRRHLAPNGAFLFDVNTRAAFRERWSMTGYRSTSDYVVHEHGLADPTGEFGWLELEVFVRRGRRYERYTLPFCQRAFTTARVRRLLKEAGFERVHVAPFDPSQDLRNATRLLVSARRGSRTSRRR